MGNAGLVLEADATGIDRHGGRPLSDARRPGEDWLLVSSRRDVGRQANRGTGMGASFARTLRERCGGRLQVRIPVVAAAPTRRRGAARVAGERIWRTAVAG